MLSIYTARINIYILLHTHIIFNAYQRTAVGERIWVKLLNLVYTTLPRGAFVDNLICCFVAWLCGAIFYQWLIACPSLYLYVCTCSILRAELNRSRGLSLRCFSVSNLLREYTRPIAVGENILLMGCVVWSHVTQHAWILPAVDRRIPNLCRSVLFTYVVYF